MTPNNEFSKILNQMKYLMEYDTSLSCSDNQKKLLTEKPLLFPTSDKYSEAQIAEIYSNNQIRKAGGGTMYVNADIKINDILPADGKNEGWTPFKNLTRDDGKPWSDEEYQKYLALPIINEFVESDGTQIKLYASKFKPKNPNDWNWSFSYLKKSDPNIKGKVTKINEPYDEKTPLRVYDWKKDDTSTPQYLEVKKINTEVTPGGYLEFKVTNPKNSVRILRIKDVNPIPGPYQATNPTDEVSSRIFTNKTYLENWNKVFISDESYRNLRKGLGYTISPAILFAYDEDAGPILKVEPFFKGDILPGQSVKIKVKINDKFGAPKHEFLDANIQTGEPFYSRNWNGFTFKLSILTTEGEIEFNSRTKQSSIESRLSQNLSIVQNLISNRLSIYNEFEVPKGFAPQCYDQFLQELYTQMTATPDDSCKQHIEKFFSDPKVKQKYQFDMSRFEVRKGYPKVGVKCNLNAIKIIEKYDGGKTFPKGICPEQRKAFEDKSKEFKDELQDIENQMKKIEERLPEYTDVLTDDGFRRGPAYLNDADYQRLARQKEQLESNIQGLVQYYGADTRSEFDRFMQEDFIWWQLGAVAVLTLISRGATWPAFVTTLAEATGVAEAVVAANVARFGAVAYTLDIAANAVAGTYFIANDKTPEGMICFFFMALPVVHKLYPKLTRLFYDSEINIARQIGKILNGLKPGQIRTAADLEALALTMSAEQRAVFKKYAQNIVTEDIRVMMRLIGEQAVQKGSRASLGYLKNLLLNTVSFGSTLAVDFLLIHELKKFYESVVDQINMRYPGLIKTEMQKRKIETYLNSLSTASLEALALFLNAIQQKSNLNDMLRGAMMLDVASGNSPKYLEQVKQIIIKNNTKPLTPEQEKKVGDDINELVDEFLQEKLNENTDGNVPNKIELVYFWEVGVEVIGDESFDFNSLIKKRPTFRYPPDTFLDLVKNDPDGFSELEGIWDYKGTDKEVIKALNNPELFIDLTPNNKKDNISKTIPKK